MCRICYLQLAFMYVWEHPHHTQEHAHHTQEHPHHLYHAPWGLTARRARSSSSCLLSFSRLSLNLTALSSLSINPWYASILKHRTGGEDPQPQHNQCRTISMLQSTYMYVPMYTTHSPYHELVIKVKQQGTSIILYRDSSQIVRSKRC